MSFPKRYNTIIINALLGVVVCLVINFSYLLTLREQERRDFEADRWWREIENQPSVTGTLRVSGDGFGYLMLPDSVRSPGPPPLHLEHEAEGSQRPPRGPGGRDAIQNQNQNRNENRNVPRKPGFFGAPGSRPADSIYVNQRDIDRMGLVDGCTLRVVAFESRSPGANPVMARVLEIDGKPYDYGERYDHPSDEAVMVLQLVYYFLFTFVLLTLMTAGAARNISVRFYLTRAAWCVVAAVAMWMLMPVIRPRSDDLVIMAAALRGGGVFAFDIMILKSSFVLAFALLYGRTYQLIHQREGIMLENEQLKSENLRAKYNTLVSQINPHFLFNSLNSLSSLVREGKVDDAVSYIDRLSDTFRYSIRNEPGMTTTLGEELDFVAAYKYLLEVRYAEKLFIDIEVDQAKLAWMLPTFSIQPLIENAVKHNTISRARPLHISIRTEGDRLVVSNPINPKLEPENGTGIGLANLSNRWLLLTGRDIEVRSDGATFTVALPFIQTI